MILCAGHVVALTLPFRVSPRYYLVTSERTADDGIASLALDGPFHDLACKVRDYNDASTAPKFHPDSFALKADVKDAT